MKEIPLNCVMLIDDDEPTNYLNRELISESGLVRHILIFPTGKSALRYLSDSAHNNDPENYPLPEMIFLDINMPAMNGWEFLDQYGIISKLTYPPPRLVMLTTSTNPDDAQRASVLQSISGYCNKPLTIPVLEKLVKQYFPERLKNGHN